MVRGAHPTGGPQPTKKAAVAWAPRLLKVFSVLAYLLKVEAHSEPG
jgi:hypothetical protein